MSKLIKVLLVIERKMIALLNYFSPAKYMNFYTRYLAKIGVNMMGKPSYIDPSAYIDGVDYSLVSIGKECVISRDVALQTHDYSSIRALNAIGCRGGTRVLSGISIGNNTFIGAGSIILPGTTIGDNVIVGAGSVVKGNISSDVVIAGNPARVIKTTIEYAEKIAKMQGIAIEGE